MSHDDALLAAIVATLEALTSWWFIAVLAGSFTVNTHCQRKAQQAKGIE